MRAFLAALVLTLAPQARPEGPLLRPPLWVDADDKNVPEPPERDFSEIWDVTRNTWLRHLDLSYIGLAASDRPALNVNAWDEVPDSSWFTNRIGRRPVSIEELLEGAPGVPPRPGKWEVNRLKTQGYTPGVRFRDSAGEGFVLKLDLPQAPERNSAADKIGSLLMHAAGYYAPQNTVVTFRPEDLVLASDARFEDLLGRRRPMTQADLDAVISTLSRRPDGTIRALASHYLPGIPKGPFPYWGKRKDDPNDLIPHELRRELRGFRVIASWFNHVDVKEVNTLDVFVKKDDGGHLRHYLIDFGSTMGSGDFMNGPKRVGHEYLYDGPATMKSFVTFGGWERPWERECQVHFPEVGHFESDLFEPEHWKPNYPNLAFEEMDASDAYWGAKIVTAFTDEMIEALVSAGNYSRPEVRAEVERTFRERRDRIGRYWFSEVSPLEGFELSRGEGVSWNLRFRNLAVERGYARSGERRYRFELRDPADLERIDQGETSGEISLQLDPSLAGATPDRFGRTVRLVVDVFALSEAQPVRVVIGNDSDGGPKVLGWEHAPR
jgi:hypothetical protein